MPVRKTHWGIRMEGEIGSAAETLRLGFTLGPNPVRNLGIVCLSLLRVLLFPNPA